MYQTANQASVYTATRYLLVLAGAWLAAYGYIKNTDINDAVSAIMIVGPVAWGIVQNYRTEHTTVAAMNSALAMAADNAAIDVNGAVVPWHAAAVTPPRAITPETAPEIMAAYSQSKAV